MRDKKHRRHSEELGEPEILPMMNVLFMLVMVLMGMSAFLPIGVISTESPKLGGPSSGAGGEVEQKKELNLTIMLLPGGINLSVGGALIKGPDGGPLFPKIDQEGKLSYNYEALQQKLSEIKSQHPEESRVLIMAGPDVIYDAIIKTMDASRVDKNNQTLFPSVMFVPGVLQ